MADNSPAGRPDPGDSNSVSVTEAEAEAKLAEHTEGAGERQPTDHVDVVEPVEAEGRVEQMPTTIYGTRREARERALSLLYEADAKDIVPAVLLAEIPVEPPPFVTSLVAGVGTYQDQIDELIVRYAIDWTIDRMPVIDRMVVRIATFELLHRLDVPTGVVISEAVELAKRYSTDESGRFVNGILASIAAEIRPLA